DDETQIWDWARGSVPKPQFDVLWLRYHEEMNVAEIARVLRKTQTSIKVLLFRARKSLARRFKTKTTAVAAPEFPTSPDASRQYPQQPRRSPLTPALSPSEGGEGNNGRIAVFSASSPSPPSEGERAGVRGPLSGTVEMGPA